MEIEQKFEEFIVTARKWRPLSFHDVIGQDHITVTLQNAIANKRIHHAYLFSGPRGVGKTTTARILARAVNCISPVGSEPCNECISCKPILENRSMDVIEIDGASNNSVDDIRKLRENAKYPPSAGKYKLYVIDEVHMLSTAAFNALLKTLEEPPPHLMFVFATTEAHKVPATILSRCQRFEFHRMEVDNMTAQLKTIAEKEGITIDEESLITIAKKADGSMRDSQSIFDQVVAFCGKSIKYSEMSDALHLIDVDFYFRITNSIVEKNLNEMFLIAQEVIQKGYDFQECLAGLLEHLRNLLTVCVTGGTKLIDSSGSYLGKYENEAKRFTKPDLLRLMSLAATTEQALRFAPQPRIKFEMALVQMASIDKSIDISELLSELKELKKKPLTLVREQVPSDSPIAESVPEPSAGFKSRKDSGLNLSSNADLSLNMDLLSSVGSLSSSKSTEPKPVENNSSATKELKNVTAAELKSGWKSFLEKYAIAENDLSMMKHAYYVQADFFNNEVILKTGQIFVSANLEKRKTPLNTFLNEFYGTQIKLKIINDETMSNEPTVQETPAEYISIDLADDFIDKEIEPPTSTAINNSHKDLSGKHPVEKAIIDMFNAKELKANLF